MTYDPYWTADFTQRHTRKCSERLDWSKTMVMAEWMCRSGSSNSRSSKARRSILMHRRLLKVFAEEERSSQSIILSVIVITIQKWTYLCILKIANVSQMSNLEFQLSTGCPVEGYYTCTKRKKCTYSKSMLRSRISKWSKHKCSDWSLPGREPPVGKGFSLSLAVCMFCPCQHGFYRGHTPDTRLWGEMVIRDWAHILPKSNWEKAPFPISIKE